MYVCIGRRRDAEDGVFSQRPIYDFLIGLKMPFVRHGMCHSGDNSLKSLLLSVEKFRCSVAVGVRYDFDIYIHEYEYVNYIYIIYAQEPVYCTASTVCTRQRLFSPSPCITSFLSSPLLHYCLSAIAIIRPREGLLLSTDRVSLLLLLLRWRIVLVVDRSSAVVYTNTYTYIQYVHRTLDNSPLPCFVVAATGRYKTVVLCIAWHCTALPGTAVPALRRRIKLLHSSDRSTDDRRSSIRPDPTQQTSIPIQYIYYIYIIFI
jgi:hypothetical protein